MKRGEIKKLDILWGKAVRKRDKKCMYCYKEETLNAHHIFTKRSMITRYDIENGITLCVSHHTWSHIFSAHETPRAFYKWLESQKGKSWLDDLEIKSNKTCKNLNYKEIKEQLEEIINNLT